MSELFKLDGQTHTYIGEQTALQGSFVFKGHTLIAGSLQGEVKITEGSPLIIESTGTLKGTVHCDTLKVYGNVEGEIVASGHVIFYPSAVFTGKIEAGNLTIFPGSRINMEARSDATV